MWIRYVWPQARRGNLYSTAALAKRFEVSKGTILEIIRNNTYAGLYVEEYPDIPDAFWRTDDPEQQLVLLRSIDEEEISQ